METTANCAVGKARHLLESPREIVSDEALLPLPASVRIITASPPPGSPLTDLLQAGASEGRTVCTAQPLP